MRPRRPGCLVALAVASALLYAAPSAAEESDLAVRVDRTTVHTSLGKKFRFDTTVANNGTSQSAPLVAHMTVFSLREGPYVDPEDWSSQRTRYLAPIPAGESRTVSWGLHAVNDGTFAASVEVVPQSGLGTPTAGPTVRLDVAQRNTLDAGGILPLALGVPACLALLAGGVNVKRRRR